MIPRAKKDTAKYSNSTKSINAKKNRKDKDNCKNNDVVYEERIYRGEHSASAAEQDFVVENNTDSSSRNILVNLEKSSNSNTTSNGTTASEDSCSTQYTKRETTTSTLSAAVTASSPPYAAVPLQQALRSCWPEIFPSRSGAKKAIRKGLIMVRGQQKPELLIKGKCDTKISIGDVLLRKIPALAPPRHASRGPSTESILKRAIGGNLVIAYLDPHLAIVVKPHGMPVHKLIASSSKNVNDDTTKDSASAAAAIDKTVSLHELLLHCLPKDDNNNSYEPLRRPAPLHRLDQPTYGLVLVARTQQAAHHFGNVLQERNQVRKRYRAIVHGQIDNQTSGCSNFIRTNVSGKECLTEYAILQRLEIWIKDGTAIIATDSVGKKPSHSIIELTLVDLILHTGRKHQLRKHLASIGNPIVGDAKYGFCDLDERLYKATTEAAALDDATAHENSNHSLPLLLAAVEITIPHFTTKQQMVETTKHYEKYQHCVMANDAKTLWNGALLKVSIDMPSSMKTLLKHHCRASNGMHACK